MDATTLRNSRAPGKRGLGRLALIDLRDIARALGGDVGGGQVVAPGPGHSPHDRSLAIRLSAESPFGFIAHSHAGDDWRVCRDYVLGKLGLSHADTCQATAWRKPRPRQDHVPDDHERRQHKKAGWLWALRESIAGTIAERYLREARHYNGPLPPTLAFLPPRKPEYLPAMIAAFGTPDEPEPHILGEPRGVDAIHLTFLRPDGSGKAKVSPDKLIVGRPLGRPIVLAPANDLLGLTISEGIEDALTAHEATGLGAWAAGAAGFMAPVGTTVPSFIEAVTIFAHPDMSGQRGAEDLAATLGERGFEIRIEGLRR
jgi:hypothetical protein